MRRTSDNLIRKVFKIKEAFNFMKGVIKFFLISVLVLLISGCQQNQGQTNLGGIDMQFLESQPLIECINEPGYCLEDGSGFNVGIKLINNLPYIVDGASLCISDTASDSIGGIPNQKPCLEGISVPAAEQLDKGFLPGSVDIYFPQGGGSYFYTGISKGNEQTNIYAELRYPATSNFKISEVCIKNKPSTETDFPCESKQVFMVNQIKGDRAPVVVEKVEKNIVAIPNSNVQAKVRLNVYLRKANSGEVFFGDSQENKIYFEVTLGNDATPFYCSDSMAGVVDFKGVTKEIQCEQTVSLAGQNAYNDALNFKLNYNYYVLLPTGMIQLTEGIR